MPDKGSTKEGALYFSGKELREMMSAATIWLEKSAPDVDFLNVYPVPDGDTGTNMLLTMRSTMEEAYRAPDNSASAIANAMAHGALMGARGNSGVILSQILRGLAKGLDNKEQFDAGDFAKALLSATETAYKALTRPVEGTILTVIRESAEAAKIAASQLITLTALMEAVVHASRIAVAKTPLLLDVLREAGVVDAGGQGLHVIFEGALKYLKGEAGEMNNKKPEMIASAISLTSKMPATVSEKEEAYGYCTEFLLEGHKFDPDKLRNQLDKKGKCVIVVGDDKNIRVHIHTLDPGAIIHLVTRLGELHQIKIQNMDDQHEDYLEIRKSKPAKIEIAAITVANGDGIIEVFKSLGISAIVPGGQTMNPSAQELLQAIETVNSDKVILLPNNSNIIPTANQVKGLTKKKLEIIPTTTIPQGIAALLAFNYDTTLEENIKGMERARQSIKTLEITKSIRDTRVNGLSLKKGQSVCLLDGKLFLAAKSPADCVLKAVEKQDMENIEIATIYYGAGTKKKAASLLLEKLKERYPHIQLELVCGGQPHYNYLVSLE